MLPTPWKIAILAVYFVLYGLVAAGVIWLARALVYDWMPRDWVGYFFVGIMGLAIGYLAGEKAGFWRGQRGDGPTLKSGRSSLPQDRADPRR